MNSQDRRQRIVERITEDESLQGDLEDPAARMLNSWAIERARAAAADTARSDDEVARIAQAIRRAARQAAHSGEHEPARVVEHANALLEQLLAATGTASQHPGHVQPERSHQPAAEQPRQRTIRAWWRAQVAYWRERIRKDH